MGTTDKHGPFTQPGGEKQCRFGLVDSGTMPVHTMVRSGSEGGISSIDDNTNKKKW